MGESSTFLQLHEKLPINLIILWELKFIIGDFIHVKGPDAVQGTYTSTAQFHSPLVIHSYFYSVIFKFRGEILFSNEDY